MDIGHLDCFAGAAGDMLVGSALAAGAPFAPVAEGIARLGLGGLHVEAVALRRGGLAATHFVVQGAEEQSHRGLADVLGIVRAARYPSGVEERIVRTFEQLAAAEAEVHGIAVERVHFHEVGALDAIADVCGAVLAFAELGLERVSCRGVVTGFGTVRCAHGELPVPAPATALLLQGVPVRSGAVEGEFTTPTGAALLRTLVDVWEDPPPHRTRAIGYGAGSKDTPGRPNVVRLTIGETLGAAGEASVVELRVQLDNCTGELLGLAMQRLLAAGALDVLCIPAFGKKNRPAQLLLVLVDEARREEIEVLVLSELPTLGLRRVPCERRTLERSVATRDTVYGPVRCKQRLLPGGQLLWQPEADELDRIARAEGLPVPVVLDRILRGGA